MVFEILLLTLVLVIVLRSYLDNFHSKRPPGPWRLPFLGSVLHLGISKSNPTHIALDKVSKKYGPISSFNMGLYEAVVVDNFEMIRKLLNHELWVDRIENHPMFTQRTFDKSLGIIFNSGDTWKEMRRFTIRTLRDFGYGKQKSMENVLEDEVKDLVSSVASLCQENTNSVVEMKYLFSMPVLNVLWSMVCSTRSPEDDKRLKELLTLVSELSRGFSTTGELVMPFPFLRHIFPGLNGAYRNCNLKIQEYFKDLLTRRREEGIYKMEQRDYVDVFLKEIDNHKELGSNPNYYTDENLIATTIDLFEAGAETTSNTLEFGFLYLLNNPRVQTKVQEEIDKVIGRNRLPCITDKTEMVYTEATLMEIQRLSNVVVLNVRCPTEDVWEGGYFIKKGTFGFLSTYSVHMDENLWGDPESFRPERFLGTDGKIIGDKAQKVLPFGGGKRLCLGETLARATLFTYFTTLLQNFTFEKCDTSGNQDPVLHGFTLTPGPYRAKICKR